MEKDIIFQPLQFRNLTIKNRIFRSNIAGRFDNYDGSGSVSSLQDLLEKPENRPKVFYRGFDVYDQEKVGFISTDSEAERVGFKYDTSVTANSNQGHLYGTDLSAEDNKSIN